MISKPNVLSTFSTEPGVTEMGRQGGSCIWLGSSIVGIIWKDESTYFVNLDLNKAVLDNVISERRILIAPTMSEYYCSRDSSPSLHCLVIFRLILPPELLYFNVHVPPLGS